MKKLQVLVCGAAGFIGRNMIERLAARDDLEVSGTVFKTPPTGSLLNSDRVHLFQVDLTDPRQVDRVIRGQEVVIQAAAVTTGSKDGVTRPYLHVTDNAVMNSHIFRACFERKVRHLIFFSCTTMYPNHPGPVKEEDFNHEIIAPYFGAGWTKVYLEKMCEFYSRIGDTRTTAIRHSNVYGPYDKFDLERSHVFGATVTKVMTSRNGKVTVWGDGSEARDLLYVSDLVDLVELLLSSQKERFELINVGCGRAIPIQELVSKIIEVSGRNLKVEFDRSKPTIPFSLALDTGKVFEKYGWRPRVSLEEGIRKTLDWYQGQFLSKEVSV